jgi:hypothetical protein
VSKKRTALSKCFVGGDPGRPKRQYDTQDAAERAVPDRGALADGRIQVYRCGRCKHWHIGHRQPTVRSA